jgi:hypothetical protein
MYTIRLSQNGLKIFLNALIVFHNSFGHFMTNADVQRLWRILVDCVLHPEERHRDFVNVNVSVLLRLKFYFFTKNYEKAFKELEGIIELLDDVQIDLDDVSFLLKTPFIASRDSDEGW